MTQQPHGFARLSAFGAPQDDLWIPIAKPIRVPRASGLRPGCYRLAVRPYNSSATFHGALRVEEGDAGATVSGDLYRYPRFTPRRRTPWLAAVEQPPDLPPPTMSRLGQPVRPLGVPFHPPGRYAARLCVTGIRPRPGAGARGLAIAAEEYRYTPPGGAFGGTFSPAPRVVTLVVEPALRAPGYADVYFEGTMVDDRGVRGKATLGRVSSRVH
jgi:hypothetical protein